MRNTFKCLLFFLFSFLNHISFFIIIVFFLIHVFVKYWFYSQAIFVIMKLNLAFYDIFVVDPWLFSLFHVNNFCWNTFLVLDKKFPSLFVHPAHLSSYHKKFGFFPLLKVCIKPFFHIKSSVLV